MNPCQAIRPRFSFLSYHTGTCDTKANKASVLWIYNEPVAFRDCLSHYSDHYETHTQQLWANQYGLSQITRHQNTNAGFSSIMDILLLSLLTVRYCMSSVCIQRGLHLSFPCFAFLCYSGFLWLFLFGFTVFFCVPWTFDLDLFSGYTADCWSPCTVYSIYSLSLFWMSSNYQSSLLHIYLCASD